MGERQARSIKFQTETLPSIQSAAIISRGVADFSLAGQPMVVDRKAAELMVQVQGGRTVLILRQ